MAIGKKAIIAVVGQDRFLRMAFVKNLALNFYADYVLFKKHSTVFKVDNIKKIEAKIILDYHGLEKGMLFEQMKPAFAKERILRLHKYLNLEEVIRHAAQNSQLRVAYQVICKYYELHQQLQVDITSFYTEEQYKKYQKILGEASSPNFNGVIEYNREKFYGSNKSEFEVFAHSRKSIRDFTGEKIPKDVIDRAIELALTAPSVCNRQASNVYLIEDKEKIDRVLEVQGGFKGYGKNVSQLLILTNDRNFYYTIGERNQLYVDGGIFLMNLLYSLHYYEIANCPANWGKEVTAERKLSQFVTIPESQKIICIIPIGVSREKFRVTLSERRPLNEVLKTL
ncbi:nitroreductase family protein [Dyadobacter fermentans]|uniref:Nitroreductase n=1 Tax=Dyadobacter fermentans (strain ATCC 700827 / DSM 18053 / CIP 107007 / KCTC 52180 / NS114) TaxID=471854 RepID=C6VUM3_DYAFD|nr:nitroreductase family protein [Dyadobacter fermentans]ACT91332.1 nitroreductase [Dyadobacter fermentans DSM 18053]